MSSGFHASSRVSGRNDRVTEIQAIGAAVLLCLAGQAAAQTGAQPAEGSNTLRAVGNAAATNAPRGSGRAVLLPPGSTQPEETDEGVRVGDNLVVDLHVSDEEINNVLEMLSIQSQRNIVASRNVSARVTANLYGVTFYEALDAILNVNGYGYIEKGNFIYVYTAEEIRAIIEAQRVRVSRVVRLSFLNAVDAAEFVKPLLGEGGQIKTNGKTAGYSLNSTGPTGSDDYANEATLVIYDFEENVNEMEKLIRQLDTRPAQVLVEATILQTALSEANAFGVDFSAISNLDFRDFVGTGGPLKTVDSLITGRGGRVASDSGTGGGSSSTGAGVPVPDGQNAGSINITPGNTSGPATFKLGITANDVSVFIRLLDEVTDTTILSKPKVLALNRQPARVLVGRRVGYLNTTSTDTATTQTVQFLDTGTQLYFRPFVTSEGMIRLELRPQVSDAVIRDIKDATGAAVTIPDEITNELTTNVLVGDGQTIVLGGLFRESTNSTRRQVPFLGDIPIIGNAFRGKEDQVQRSEIIFLITPTILNDTILTEQGKRGQAMVERVRTGAREGLLPWSRDKMTGMMLVEADRLAAEGNTAGALWKIERALRLNPVQPDAVGMRERLTGKADVWPGRSMLEDVIHQETQKRLKHVADGGDVPAVTASADGVETTTSPDAVSLAPTQNGAPTPTTATTAANGTTGTSGTTTSAGTTATTSPYTPTTVSTPAVTITTTTETRVISNTPADPLKKGSQQTADATDK